MRLLHLLVVGRYAVVSEVDELVAYLLRIVIYGRKSNVAFIIKPDRKRIEVSYEHPLTNIEFST